MKKKLFVLSMLTLIASDVTAGRHGKSTKKQPQEVFVADAAIKFNKSNGNREYLNTVAQALAGQQYMPKDKLDDLLIHTATQFVKMHHGQYQQNKVDVLVITARNLLNKK